MNGEHGVFVLYGSILKFVLNYLYTKYMPDKENANIRHRMVVEEIEIPENKSQEPENESPKETPHIEATEGVKEIQPEEQKNRMVSSAEIAQQQPQALTEIPQNVSKEKSPVPLILISGIFILGAILGGIIFYQKGVNTNPSTPAPEPTPTVSAVPVATPASTPKAVVDISKFNIAVFNGSGTAGEASKAKALLTDAGFNVVSTGNAATYDYTKTIIKAKSTVDASVIQKIKDALSKVYVVGDSQTLSSSSTTDIQIVVGSSKAE